MTSLTNEQQRLDVLTVMDRMNDLIRGEFIGPNDLDLTDEGLIEKGQQARAAVADLIEALSECVIDMEVTEEFYGDHPRAQEVIAKAKAALSNVGAQP